MSVKEYKVEGYKEYNDLFCKLSAETKNRIISLFCASLDSNGRSWCGDCRDALPVVNEAVKTAKEKDKSSFHYVFVSVEREEWKNKANDFRQNADLKLTNIPTLVLWEKGSERKRLTERECLDKENVFSIFL